MDFNPPRNTNLRARPPRWRLPLLVLACTLATALFFLDYRPAVPDSEARSAPAEIKAPPPPEIYREIVDGEIQPGDSITTLLGAHLSLQEIQTLAGKSGDVFPLSKICAGQPFKLCLADGSFERFEYDINRDDQLIIRKDGEEFDIARVPITYTVETETIRGSITSSLFEAVAEVGENPELALALADIFAWDIDFIRDIRVGDAFQSLVEKRYRDGIPAGYGKVLAAEFVNQGTNYQAFLFQDGDRAPSYYDAEGNSLRKAFLRAPLPFSRVSSGFTMRRFHPITKTWKAHPAIDYAAPTGTPIKAVGDGTIIRKGYTKYNGNFIKIRHNSSYETLYLHMSKFARGIAQGKRILQGQVIGYVGSTGLATGPHLCFRMYKNGAPVNPNRVKTASAAPISRDQLPAYSAAIAPLAERLAGKGEILAHADFTESPPPPPQKQ
jgi:murein DD-endopeptidase MepM/ murein hydrolase activator NlpD